MPYPDVSPEDLVQHEQLLLKESIQLLSRGLPPEKAIREMLHLLSELLGLNRGRIVLRDAETGQLAIKVAYGLTPQEIERGRYAQGEGVTGRVMQSGETMIIQDIDDEPLYLGRAVMRATLPPETVSFIAMPIRLDQITIGVFGVHRLRSRTRPLGADLQILRTISELIGQIFRIEKLIEERTQALQAENLSLKVALQHKETGHGQWGIIGDSPQLRSALNQLTQVSASSATVMLLGESGTGKELFARALHLQSPRRDRPFIKVNCAAIPETLFEAELFGHEKGAFTGAHQQRIGRFEQAHGGTLFLDEIGDLPMPVQVKLLRVLQEQVLERLGGRQEIHVDVRVVAATHQDMMALVREGRFRLDLYYRLNVIPIRLPSLRERKRDIDLLVSHFISQLNQKHQRNLTMTSAGMQSLTAYPWPGNIRQLFNVLERIVLLSPSDVATEETVELALVTEAQGQSLDPALLNRDYRLFEASGAPSVPMSTESAIRPYHSISGSEREHIAQALVSHGGNKSQAARFLNMTLRQLNYRIQVLEIPNIARRVNKK